MTNKTLKEEWKEELYCKVLEDLLFHQKMLPHHRNQQEGMDEIRENIQKLEQFISNLLTSHDALLLLKRLEEMNRKPDSMGMISRDKIFGYNQALEDIKLLITNKEK